MNHLLITLLFPILLTIGLGWILTYIPKLPIPYIEKKLTFFLFNIGLPIILFISAATMSISLKASIQYTIAYCLTVLLTFAISYYTIQKYFQLTHSEASFAGLCASFSNAALIGLPLLIKIFGVQANIPVTLTLLVYLLVFLPLIITLVEFQTQPDQQHFQPAFLKAISASLKTPLIIAASLGILFKLTGLTLPSPLLNMFTTFNHLIAIASLLVIGLGLRGITLASNIGSVVTVIGFNLILKPILAIIFALIFRLDNFYAISLLVVSSVPTAKTLYVLSKQYETYENNTACIIFGSSVFSMVTFPLFLAIAILIWQ